MREELKALQWYIETGADEALGDAPHSYFSESPSAPLPSPFAGENQGRGKTGGPSAPPSLILSRKAGGDAHSPAPPASLASAIADARALADKAETLADLEAAVRGFDGCAIKRTATNTVFADGNPQARLMLVGEAPGAQEDAKGIPFCGPSGQLLDKMLTSIGYDRTMAYITNTLFWRPPGNRQPSTEELAICKPFVERHVALIDPALLVMVGGTATKAMLATEQGITRLRGKRFTYRTPYRDKDYPVAVLFHPSYLLRSPEQKRATWQDLLAIKELLL